MSSTQAPALKEAFAALCSAALSAGAAPRVSVSIEEPVESLDFFAQAPALGEERVALIEDELGRSVVGVGVAAVRYQPAPASSVTETIRHAGALAEQAPWVGGVRFDVTRRPDALWAPFGAARFVRPQLALVREGARQRLVLELPADSKSRTRLLRALQTPAQRQVGAGEMEPKARAVPEEAAWTAEVNAALAALCDEQRPLQKVVLAQRKTLQLGGAPDPAQVLGALRKQAGVGAAFLLQPFAGCAFVGVSPELLARREGRTLRTEALAGTRARDGDPRRDAAAQRALLESEKDQREHRFVQRFIAEQLEKVGVTGVRAGAVRLRSLRHLHHLHAPMSAKLHDEAAFADVVSALHPTPAVAGTPRNEALDFIAQHEPFDRGLYAGAVGRLGGGTDALYVGIRSLLLANSAAHIFAGAGIVQGSDATREWQEVAQKRRGAERALFSCVQRAAHAG